MTKIKKTYIINQTCEGDEDLSGVFDVCYGISCATDHMLFLCNVNFGIEKEEFDKLFNKETNTIEFCDEEGHKITMGIIEVKDTRTRYQKCHDLMCHIDLDGDNIVVRPFDNTDGITDCFF